ncbi:MAG TPA: DsbA family protein [Stellaceae bacterium]|jgi:protein-disulfide isomerase|nr:DsbA family protein [Stellaceae bacterium]
MREMWFALVAVLTLAGVDPAAAQTSSKPAGNAANLLAPTPQDRILGKPDAPITIIEYASLTCPHCAHFEKEVLPKLKEKWVDTGKAKLILRDFPLDEPAMRAAMVARCAPPDRFYPLVDTFFADQDKWVTQRDYRAALERLAKLGGVGDKEFKTCISDKKLEDQVAQSRLTASQDLGVDATPTFFINGTKYNGDPTVEAFDQLLSGLAAKS